MKQFGLYFFSILVLISCEQNKKSNAGFTSDPILLCKTVKKLNDIVLENRFPPMIAARNYAYASVAAYEAMAAGSKKYKSLAGQLNGLKSMEIKNTDTVNVDFHLAALLAFIKVSNNVTFPEGSMMGEYDALLKQALDAGISDERVNKTKYFSGLIIDHIMKWSRQDNYLQTRSYPKYTVVSTEGRWVPTPPAFAGALEAHWKSIRTMVIDSASQFMPARPNVYDIKNKNSDYYKAVTEVKTAVDSLSADQKHQADFWDDNPARLNVSGHVSYETKKFSPAGHWMNIVGIAVERSGADLEAAICAYTKTAIAIFDGFISCWDEKYLSNMVRPETVIIKYIDPGWRPYIQTPPFPSYTSGHSVISAAAAEMMTDEFGDNFSYTDTSEAEFGIKHRSFISFRQAALEASISRMYGGIHYREDLENGNVQGRLIGEFILRRLKMRR